MDIYKDDNNTIIIKGSLVVAEIETAYPKLEPLLEQVSNSITVDLVNVEEVDTAGLQLILSLKKTAEESGSFYIKDLSNPLKEAIRVSGLDQVLKENMP